MYNLEIHCKWYKKSIVDTVCKDQQLRLSPLLHLHKPLYVISSLIAEQHLPPFRSQTEADIKFLSVDFNVWQNSLTITCSCRSKSMACLCCVLQFTITSTIGYKGWFTPDVYVCVFLWSLPPHETSSVKTIICCHRTHPQRLTQTQAQTLRVNKAFIRKTWTSYACQPKWRNNTCLHSSLRRKQTLYISSCGVFSVVKPRDN